MVHSWDTKPRSSVLVKSMRAVYDITIRVEAESISKGCSKDLEQLDNKRDIALKDLTRSWRFSEEPVLENKIMGVEVWLRAFTRLPMICLSSTT